MLGFQASRKAVVAALTGSASAAASASASPATRLALAAATVRSFYTFNVPTDTPRIQLDDGSKLVFLQRLEPAQVAAAVRAAAEAARGGRPAATGPMLSPSLDAVPSKRSSLAPSAENQKQSLTKKEAMKQDQAKKLKELEASRQLPPRVRTFPERAMLSSEQINRMRELRESDPDSWTVLRLAREFNTFPGFVMMVTRCPKERVDFLLEKAQQDFDAISISKKLRAINRLRRKELW